jgi:hypothetical protein
MWIPKRPRRHPGPVVVAVAAMLTVSACTDTSLREGEPGATSVGQKCDSPSKIRANSHGLEIESSAADGMTLYGLIQADPYPLVASADVKKIVWRASGTGEVAVTVGSPDGATRPLTWGPEYHSDSNYDRPGDEYGSGLVTEQPGCWHVRFSRGGSGSADVWFDVAQR